MIPVVEQAGASGAYVGGTATFAGVPEGWSPDTSQLVAQACALSQAAPGPYGSAFATYTGSIETYPDALVLPSMAYAVRPGDSIERIAGLVRQAVWNFVQANAGATAVLRSGAELGLPVFPYAIQARDTLASVAVNFGLTMEELAASVENTTGLFANLGASGPNFVVPDIAIRDRAQLIADFIAHGRVNDLAGMASRFLMHGGRAPQPDLAGPTSFPADIPLHSLYELTGQQFAVPGAGATGFSAEFGRNADWFGFSPGGPQCPTGHASSLGVVMDRSEVARHMPGATFAPVSSRGRPARRFIRTASGNIRSTTRPSGASATRACWRRWV